MENVSESSSNSGRRRRRHRLPKKISVFEKINNYFVAADGVSYRREKNIVKRRRKLFKKILEYTLWGIVIAIIVTTVVNMLSEVSIKDRRNTRKKTMIFPDQKQIHNELTLSMPSKKKNYILLNLES